MVIKKKISILIVFFNEARALGKTLETVFSQRYPKELIEVICIDDGSQDQSYKIAQYYPVKLIRQKNQGLSASYNRGLKYCHGDIILFLDAHMYLQNKETLKLINDFFAKNENLAGVCGIYKTTDLNDKNFIRDIRRFTVFGKNGGARLITLDNFTTFSSAIGAYDKKIFEKNQFPENFNNSYGEDVFLQIAVHNQGKDFLYTPKIYGIHDAQISTKTLLDKLMMEIRSTSNILLKTSQQPSFKTPFLNYFLSYPLIFLIFCMSYLFISEKFILPLLVVSLVEIFPAMNIMLFPGYPLRKKFLTFCYLITKELIQIFHLPFYLLLRVRKFSQLSYIVKTIFSWETTKYKRIFKL